MQKKDRASKLVIETSGYEQYRKETWIKRLWIKLFGVKNDLCK